MLQEDKAAQTPFRTIYNDGGVANSQSPSDDAQSIQDQLFTTLGKPLKAVQQKYLTEVTKTCYPEKWMAEDFTNSEQIRNCRQKVHNQYFGAFETMVENERNSSQY